MNYIKKVKWMITGKDVSNEEVERAIIEQNYDNDELH